MQATDSTPKKMNHRKPWKVESLIWVAGALMAVAYITPSHWYSQPVHMRMDGLYQPSSNP